MPSLSTFTPPTAVNFDSAVDFVLNIGPVSAFWANLEHLHAVDGRHSGAPAGETGPSQSAGRLPMRTLEGRVGVTRMGRGAGGAIPSSGAAAPAGAEGVAPGPPAQGLPARSGGRGGKAPRAR